MNATPESLLAALTWRYATKRFDPSRKIPDSVWRALEQSLVLTPSSFGLQPWQFLVIRDPEIREQLKAASWGQSQITDASHFIVLTSRTDLTDEDVDSWMVQLAKNQEVEVDSLAPMKKVIQQFAKRMTSRERHAWNMHQTYIALGQLMASAAMIGVDTCPMEGMDTVAYDRILDLHHGTHATSVACALGYRDPADKYAARPKARFDASRVIRYV